MKGIKLDEAKKYLRRGFSVIPLNKKLPCIQWKEFRKRRATEEEVEGWAKQFPYANLGIVTGNLSGICVVDFDTAYAFENAKAKGLPNTSLVKTGRGYHAYFKYRDGIRNSAGQIPNMPNVDVRGEGGYIAAPPSIHENGIVYTWLEGQGLDDIPLAEPPEWVPVGNGTLGKVPVSELLDGVRNGQRNQSLTRVVGSWLRQGLTFEDCLKEARVWNQKNEPPDEDGVVLRTVQSIYERHLQNTDDQNAQKPPEKEEASFFRFKDGRIAEMLFDKSDKKACFAVYDKSKNQVMKVDSIQDEGRIIVPLLNDKLITPENPSVWLPSDACEYGSDAELFAEVKSFIHKYVALDGYYENLAALYAMFSWVYDCYSVLPYLRVLGDYGTGKSRFLYTIGLVCYKPMVVVAALNEAPLFRVIERYKGTLILDEANFKESDTNAAIIQILNAGFEKKASVMRCNPADYGVEQFQVFGPKVVSSRNRWSDSALESRCITWMARVSERVRASGIGIAKDEVPLYLDDSFNQEALRLRNKLLMFRFRNYGEKKLEGRKLNYPVEPRIAQILLPLASMTQSEEVLEQINSIAKVMNKERIQDRATQIEARILQAIKDIEDVRTPKSERIFLSEIVEKFNKEVEVESHISALKVSNAMKRPELNIELQPRDSSRGLSIICRPLQMEELYRKYGIIE